jgi:hypothetical protein
MKKITKEELCNLYFPPFNDRVIKSRSLQWAEHLALMEKNENGHWK